MAPLPTITGIFRVTFDFPVNLGVTPRMVHHYLNISGDEVELSQAIVNAWQSNQLKPMSQAYNCAQLSIIKLDGHSATQVIPIDPGTIKGLQTGSDQIAQACAVVSFHTTQRGPRGRGRSYVGPIVESQQANGVLDSGTQGDMADAWGTYLDGIAAEDYSLVVASYAHSDAHGVTGVSVDTIVGTQRRRIDQLR